MTDPTEIQKAERCILEVWAREKGYIRTLSKPKCYKPLSHYHETDPIVPHCISTPIIDHALLAELPITGKQKQVYYWRLYEIITGEPIGHTQFTDKFKTAFYSMLDIIHKADDLDQRKLAYYRARGE